ncbi:hypothetical protein BH10BDE1_BH10BDE1_08880 [soil metagenome]
MQTPTTSQSLLVPLLTRLALAQGHYEGDGMNHADEKFRAVLDLKSELDQSLIQIQFRASDSDNAFHEERTWITEDLVNGGIGLWTVSTNTPGLLSLKLVEDSNDGSYTTRVVFRIGERDDMSRFREEISLSLRHDGGLEYVYSWGVPHEAFGVKSKALLKRISAALNS